MSNLPNLVSYKLMPPLYSFEDYRGCLGHPTTNRSEPATYCVVYAEITPNKTSALWNFISTFSSESKYHYRHDHLFFGVCMERCRKLLRSFNKLQGNFYEGTAQDQELIKFYEAAHKHDAEHRIRYHRETNICLNYGFRASYHLSLRTSIEYCEVANRYPKSDWLANIFLFLIILLAILNAFGTLYDCILKRNKKQNRQNHEFYQNDLENGTQTLLTSFSLCRNYYRLITPPNRGIREDLRFFDFFRVFTSFTVISAHIVVGLMSTAISDPEFFENLWSHGAMPAAHNATALVQTFFIMSGFLLNLQFVRMKKDLIILEKIQALLIMISYRYLKIALSLGVMTLFNSTFLIRLQDGPFWRHSAEPEYMFCRQYWWKNIFFINNFLLDESCSHHTWYLAADMQLFIVFSTILTIVSIYPDLKKALFSFLIVCAFTLPALTTYYQKLDGNLVMKPETYRYFFFKDADTFKKSYIPFYNNLGGYTFGILTVDLFVYLKKKNLLKKYKATDKHVVFWWICIPVAIAMLFSGKIFMSYSSTKPSVWLALYAGLYRNCWVILSCGVTLGLCFEMGGMAHAFFKLPIFALLAKISFQSYLWHLSVIRLWSGFFWQPIFVNWINMICFIALGAVLINIIAFFITLLFELPVSVLLKTLLLNLKRKR